MTHLITSSADRAFAMKSEVAIIGAGLGGLVAARLLLDAGIDVTVYEQANAFTRLGAGIHLGPNVMKVLHRLGVDGKILSRGFEPDAWVSRDGLTGELLYRLPLRGVSTAKYGAAYVTLRRGDLHEILVEAVPSAHIALGKRLVDTVDTAEGVDLHFADGTRANAALVIGADGVNSRVRATLLDEAVSQFSGHVAYRGSVMASQLEAPIGELTKWWGPDAHTMVYYVSPDKSEIFFIAVVAEEHWQHEASFVQGDVGLLRSLFSDFHPELRSLFDSTASVTKWALFERDPLPLWRKNRVVLLGDACHPMKPHMGQGAAMAIEDATVLARCLIEHGIKHFDVALASYERSRARRAGEVQAESGRNRWLKQATDPSWVFGYDPVAVTLEP